MLEAQQAIVDRDPASPTVSVVGDAGAVAANRMVERLLEAERAQAAPRRQATA